MTADPPAHPYLLGEDDVEIARLEFQHRVWAREAYALWERAGFPRGGTLLDLGCGPGLATLDLAHLVGPRGHILAVDGSARYLELAAGRARRAGAAWVETVRADAADLELAPASLDGVYARWIFCFLPRPDAVLARLAPALKPGRSLAVTDYFNYRAFTLAPRSEAFDRVIGAVEESWQRHGGDLAIQGRMPRLMRSAGLEVVHIGQSARLARPGTPLWSWPETFFRTYLPALAAHGAIAPELLEDFWRDWRARCDEPTSFLLLPPMIDVVGRRRRA